MVASIRKLKPHIPKESEKNNLHNMHKSNLRINDVVPVV
jgi:hypothetical protein